VSDQPPNTQTHITGDPQGPIYTGPVDHAGDRTINTGGAPYVEGDLHTGGDFVARDKYVFTGTAEDARRLRNRQVMVEKVYDFWVKGVLQDSLYENVLIALNLEDKARTVTHRRWDTVVHQPEREDSLLSPGTPILDVYRQMSARMLILGEPGAGKTTMLLKLVKELIEERQDPLAPIPVVFNLSSWAEKQPPLEEWLVEDLSRNYDVSKNQGHIWVDNDELSLFLDGLDEVREEVRGACVSAINAFREARASVDVCVCCRRQEYEALPVQLALNGAVLLRPLTAAQVESYLNELGPDGGGLRTALHQDRGLQDLAESPLMVNMMLMAYQGKEPAAVDMSNTAEERKRHLFDAYIDGMFQRRVRTKLTNYARSDTIRWLSWLGRRMVDHSQTVFLIERLQPSWGQSKLAGRRIPVTAFMLMWGPLYGLLFGLLGGLLFGLLFGLLGGLLSRLSEGQSQGLSGGLIEWLHYGLIIGLSEGLRYGLTVGLLGGLIDGFSGGMREIKSSEHSSRMWRRLRSSLYSTLLGGVIFGLLGGLLSRLSEGPSVEQLEWQLSGLFNGLIGGLIGGIVGGFREVKLVGLSISWGKLRTNIHFWLTTGVIVGMLSGMLEGLIGSLGEVDKLITFGLIYGLLGGLVLEPELKTELPNITTTQVPNEGIKRSLKNTLTTGLIGGLIIGLIIGLIVGLVVGLIAFGMIYGLSYGLIVGLLGGIVGGGDAFFKHYILRFVLWRRGHMPWNYARFLDYAAERIFLRKVGGGYIFTHRLLMEHFAGLHEEEESNSQSS
jgi:hypothetical protein